MKILHAKSPCCRGRINRFGKRRRQCVTCKRTWRIRRKRRGRNRKRVPMELAIRTLIGGRTYVPRRGSVSQSGFSRRLRKAVRFVLGRKETKFPSAPSALIGDGMYFKFKHMEWVMYLLAIKPVRSRRAYFLDPVLLEGKEHAEPWKAAIAAIPANIKIRISGLCF